MMILAKGDFFMSMNENGAREKVDMLVCEDKAKAFLGKNCRYIMYKFGIETQKDFAEIIGIAQSTLVDVLQGKVIPKLYPFFQNICKLSGYTIEELINSDLEEMDKKIVVERANSVDEAQYQKLCGIYILHYYDTSAFKGRENKDMKAALVFGLLAIYKDRARKEYRCSAWFGLKKAEVLERFSICYNRYNKNGSIENAVNYLNTVQSSHKYEGTVQMSTSHIYISLNYGDKDHAYVILHRPDGTSKHYIGGLGAMVSVSKGRNSSPCMQFLGLSRYYLDVSEEEIARRLLLGYPSIKPGDKVKQLITLLKSMNQRSEQCGQQILNMDNFELDLSDVHKEYIIQGEITKIITDIVENNLFRTLKVSGVDDDEWYHYVKKFDPRKR